MNSKVMPLRKCGKETPVQKAAESYVQDDPSVQALNAAKEIIDASSADIADWIGKSRRTIDSWLAGDRLPDVVAIMKSSRLGPVFLEQWQIARGEQRAA